MQILGLLTPAEMNEVMNLSSLGISKAGGATVSEVLRTRTPLLIVGSYPWEMINAIHLVRSGLGVMIDPETSLVAQIEAALNLDPIDFPLETDWTVYIDSLILEQFRFYGKSMNLSE